MREAVEGMEMQPKAQEKLWRYLEGAAEHLLNSFED
jgi:hemoglobin